MLLPNLGLFFNGGRSDGAQVLFVRHVALSHLVEHGGQDVGEQAQLAYLSHWQRKRERDGFLGPSERDKAFDRTPQIDWVK